MQQSPSQNPAQAPAQAPIDPNAPALDPSAPAVDPNATAVEQDPDPEPAPEPEAEQRPSLADRREAFHRKVVDMAEGELGEAESPDGSNNSSRIRTYRSSTAGALNTPGPWCAYFVSWLAKEAGTPIGAGGRGDGYVPTIRNWARDTDRWREGDPRSGDAIVFDWEQDGTPDHIGIVADVDGDTVNTIEGNSANAVRRRSYDVDSSDIDGYVRLGP